MQWKQPALTLLLVFAGLVLAEGGCAAASTSRARPTEESVPAEETTPAVSTEPSQDAPAEVASTPVPVNAPAPAAAPAISPGPRVSPSVVASPARAAAAARSPTSISTTDVVALALAKDNRIALVDPTTARVAHTVDFNSPAGKIVISPDGHTAWVFAHQPQASVALLDVLTGDRHEAINFHEGDGPSDVAFSTDGTRAFVAMGGAAASAPGPSTIAFTSATGKEFGRITLGTQSPDVQLRRQLSSLAIIPGPSGDILLAAGKGSGVVWALDPGSGAVLNEIAVGGAPTRVFADPARRRAYVLLDTLNQIVSIDTTTLSITNRLQLPAQASAAAMGSDGTLFVVGGNTSGELWVVLPGAADIRARVPLEGTPVGIATSSDGKSLYIADSANNSMSIVTSDTIQITRNVTLASPPLGIAAVYPSVTYQQLAGSTAAGVAATPAPTPQLAPTPTPLPAGARAPDHLPQGAVAEPFVSGAAVPVALAFAPDGRLFYDELHTGKIRVVQNGTLLPDPFYQFLVTDQADSGLLGLALDPDFSSNHYVYAFYTSAAAPGATGGTLGPSTVVRLTDVDGKGTDLTPVLQGLLTGPLHNSGTLRFGPDGKLYVSLADDDKGTNAQDLSTLLGKILRVNPDGSVPDDNPFAGQTGKQGAIWAYGLHNAYSFAFHPVGHDLLSVDYGLNKNDELNVIARGANYGWPTSGYASKAGENDPIAVMNPPVQPTGSTFYVGDQMAAWKNDWFFCDAAQSELRRVRLAPVSFDRIVLEEVVKGGCSYDVATGSDGALYYSDARGIYRIRMPGADVLPAVRDATG